VKFFSFHFLLACFHEHVSMITSSFKNPNICLIRKPLLSLGT
jgi:hypothetical protein